MSLDLLPLIAYDLIDDDLADWQGVALAFGAMAVLLAGAGAAVWLWDRWRR